VTQVTIYAKPGCHLCEEARAAVLQVRNKHPFALHEVDISLDPVLNRRYGERVPVVAIDGEEAFEYWVDPGSLEDRLAKVHP
jgi:glutaredoxin